MEMEMKKTTVRSVPDGSDNNSLKVEGERSGKDWWYFHLASPLKEQWDALQIHSKWQQNSESLQLQKTILVFILFYSFSSFKRILKDFAHL